MKTTPLRSTALCLGALTAAAPLAAQPADPGSDASASASETEAVEEPLQGAEATGAPNAKPPQGQSAIWGVVTDSVTDEPIPDVAVDVLGTEHAAVTNAAGQYRLVLPPGKHNIRYWTDTHNAIRARGVVVWANAVRQVDVHLDRAIDQPPEEFVIEAPPPTSSMDAVTLDRKKATAVGDAVSRAEISKSADRDAAQAAKRVVGATVVGSRFVYVRGLGERYTNAQLNGAPLPSPEPDRAAVPLDLFPTGVLERLTIVKTFTPDAPGDFAGGSVRVTTRRVPGEFVFDSSVSLGFNTNTTFRDRLSYRGSNTDWLGFDSGLRAFPPDLPTDYRMAPRGERPDGTAIERDPELDPLHQQHGREVNSYMSATRSFTYPDQGLSLVVGDGWKLGRKHKFGYITSLNYRRAYKIRHETRREYDYNPTAEGGLSIDNDLEVETGSEDVNWGAFASVMYEYDDRHRLNLIGFHSQVADNNTYNFDGYWRYNDSTLHNTRLEFVSRALNVIQLQGEDIFEELDDGQLNWSLSYSIASRSEPDTRDVVYLLNAQYPVRENGGVTETPAWVFVDGSESGRHFFSEQDEESKAIGIDWTQPMVKGTAPTSLKLGTLLTFRAREFQARRMALNVQRGQLSDPALACAGEDWDPSCPDQLFLRRNIGPLLYLAENTRPEDSYAADLNVYSAYLMSDAHVTRDLRLITGGRIEVTRQTLEPTDPLHLDVEIQGADLRSTDLLPAVNLVYSATDKSKLRFALTRTIARPQLRELAPFAYSDFFGGRQTSGNPDLTLTHITNADLRFEYFPRLSEVLAFSIFYKFFVDAIEPVVGASGDSGQVTFQNAPDANLIGLELEARVGLRHLAAALHQFAVVSNLTLARSRIQVEQTDIDYMTNLSRPMVNQAPYVYNLAFDYDNEDLGLQSRLSYNLTGPQLVRVGAHDLDDSWVHPTHALDFKLSKSLGDHFKLGFKATNLLNTVHIQTNGRVRHAWNLERRYRDGIGLGISAGYTY